MVTIAKLDMPTAVEAPEMLEWLKQKLVYHPKDGQFTSAVPRRGPHGFYLGTQYGVTATPRIMVDGQTMLRKQLVWLFETGEWANDVVTRNGNRFDTRFENLCRAGAGPREAGARGVDLYLYDKHLGRFVHKTRGENYEIGDFADSYDARAKRIVLRDAPETVRAEDVAWLSCGRKIPPGCKVVRSRHAPSADASRKTMLSDLVLVDAATGLEVIIKS